MTTHPASAPVPCRHCGTSMEPGGPPFCCQGCELAARIIEGAGLERYYTQREAFAPRPTPSADLARLPVETAPNGASVVRFRLDGVRCTSCVWVAENLLARTPGVREVHISYGSARGEVAFDPEQVTATEALGRVARLGYRPVPLTDPPRTDADRDLLVRLGVAAFCAANVMLLSASVYAGWWDGMEMRYATLFHWVGLALATPAVFWSGAPFLNGAVHGIRSRVLSMDLPVSMGIVVMYLHALISVFYGQEGYLDSLTMLIAFLLGGRVLEARGRRRAQEAAESLAQSLPHRARRVTDSAVEKVPLSELSVGDHLELASGEEVAADGVVIAGSGRVRMALVTGESEPTQVRPGDRLVAGAVVLEGGLRMEVQAVGGETLLERMATELRQATDRPRVDMLADRLAPAFTVATLALAGVTFVAWWVLGGLPAAVAPTVAVLVVACPCALALAQPLSIAAGLGASARRGLLLRSGDALWRLGDVDVVALDKTGTITEGAPVVTEASDEALRIAAGLERYSLHPIGQAIVDAAIAREIPLPTATDVREVPGQGIAGQIDGAFWQVRSGGPGTVVVSGPKGTALLIRLRDAPRADAARTFEALEQMGFRTALLSGDHPAVAARIGRQVGLHAFVQGGMEPGDKQRWIAREQAGGRAVLFAGDGLNDGPALSEAQVAVAMGGGVSSSLLVADGVISRGTLGPLLAGLRAGKEARRAVHTNVARSLVYNVFAVTAAAVGLVNPLVAAILMPLSSALVVHGALGVERRMLRQEVPWKP